MSRKTVLGSLVWAIGLGTLLALFTGDRQAVSIAVWLAGFSAWFSMATVVRLLEQVPVQPARLVAVIRRRQKPTNESDRRPRELRSLEGLVIRARDHDRAHVQQLRPRLTDLTEHFLPRQYGIDPAREPKRAAVLLGELAWLVDPTVTDRTPTIGEVGRLVEVLNPDNDQQEPSR